MNRVIVVLVVHCFVVQSSKTKKKKKKKKKKIENIEDLNSGSSTVSVSNIDKCNTDNITGSVNVSNQISGYATEITTNIIDCLSK